MLDRNTQPFNTRLFDFEYWSSLTGSDDVVECFKILSFKLATNSPPVII